MYNGEFGPDMTIISDYSPQRAKDRLLIHRPGTGATLNHFSTANQGDFEHFWGLSLYLTFH